MLIFFFARRELPTILGSFIIKHRGFPNTTHDVAVVMITIATAAQPYPLMSTSTLRIRMSEPDPGTRKTAFLRISTTQWSWLHSYTVAGNFRTGCDDISRENEHR